MPHFSSPSKTFGQREPVALAWRDSAQRFAVPVHTPGSGLPHSLCDPAPSSSSALSLPAGRCPLLCQIQLMLLWLWQGPAGAGAEGVWSQLSGCGSAGSHLGSACTRASWALSLFPWDCLTFVSPHPALGNHLPFCLLHPRLCARDFKTLFFPRSRFLKLSSLTLLPTVLLSFFSPHPFQFFICAGSFSFSLFYN